MLLSALLLLTWVSCSWCVNVVTVYNGIRNISCSASLKKCLPSFIIAGFQKSGTTALAAQLSEQPNIHFPSKKEVHFFDKTSRYNVGIEEYLKPFPAWTNKYPSATDVPINTTFAEATPFYLASRVSCQRIAKTIPEVKLIAIYRDPVERAYSEYQMKLRRIREQEEFLALIARNVKQLHECMKSLPNDLDGIKKCVPLELSSHARWMKLKAALKKASEEGQKRAAKSCDEQEDHCQEPDSGALSWFFVMETCFTHSKPLTKPLQALNGSASRISGAIGVANVTDAFGSLDFRATAGSSKYITSVSGSASNIKVRSQSSMSSVAVIKELPTSAYVFNAAACFQFAKDSFESIKPLEEALQGEIEEFQECGGEALADVTNKFATDNIESVEEFNGWMDLLDGVINKCLTIRTGISTQYFYRSLYAVQLHHCFKYVPRERILLVSSDALHQSPQSTVDSVLRFLGLPSEAHSNSSSGDQVSLKVAKHFPSFEKNTGWRLKSEYEPIPSHLKSYLERFFAPYERMFAFLLTH